MKYLNYRMWIIAAIISVLGCEAEPPIATTPIELDVAADLVADVPLPTKSNLVFMDVEKGPVWAIVYSHKDDMFRLESSGKMLVSIQSDGTVTIHEDGGESEAALIFYMAVQEVGEGFVAENKKLRDENAFLKSEMAAMKRTMAKNLLDELKAE